MTLAARPRRRKGRKEPNPAVLLAWYDRHRRALPWRAGPGETPDPYRVWLSEIMLQQTTVKAVAPYYARFLDRWPSVAALAASSLDDVLKAWAGLGYYARARNLHACARAVVERHGGCFPNEVAALATLPGVGPYTAAAIAAIAFGRRATPVDGNVERVVARLFAVEGALPAAKPDIRRLAEGITPAERPGDFAQALMDLGATICTPVRPSCALCPWSDACAAHRLGSAETFPRKAPKAEGRLRRGAAFWIERADGAVLVRTRPLRGLLAGMTEVPTSEWTHDFDEAAALRAAPRLSNGKRRVAWRRLPGKVTHVFTHFPLELVVYATAVSAGTDAPPGTRFVHGAALDGEAWPSLMRKVIALAGRMG
jgi:A/G-specific adenine glycosylase